MGRIIKKGTRGAAKAYITRSKAIKKLQLTLKDFRRLCILKGIYPVEPKFKRKVKHGISQNKTYYLLDDIQYLSHEPIIWKFWELKIFMRKLKRAHGRKDYDLINGIEENKPFFRLDKIVKERYPNFIDALRDLDDGLSMLFLFSSFSKSDLIEVSSINLSRRLTVEFMNYVIESKSLKKVFVSIKGYYYQAEIMGQDVTWVVPHQFVQTVTEDVDIRVILTFVEFYITLLGFINYRLYVSLGMFYPPKLSAQITKEEAQLIGDPDMNDCESECLASLNKPILRKLESEEENKIDEFDDGNNESAQNYHQNLKFQKLFEGLKIFLNRETPRESLVFVIRSFGGQVSWDKLSYVGATFDQDDETITHQIVDREYISNKKMNRFYIQPQWIYDSVNAHRLLPVENYFPGTVLPAHLSPFVEEKEGDYIPPERINTDDQGIIEDESDNESDDEVIPAKKMRGEVKTGVIRREDKELVAQKQENEEKRLAVMMIPKKKKRLYDKIMFGKKRQAREALKLKAKRVHHDKINKK